MKALLNIFTTVMLLFAILTSCGDNDSYEFGDFNYNMVTYQGYDEGNGAKFMFYGYNDAPAITLTDPSAANPGLKKGQRLLLNYWVNDSSTAGKQTITVRQISTVTTDTLVQVESGKLAQLKREPIELQSIWRTADYINLRCKVKYTETSRLFFLAMDASTMFDDVVKCYVVQDLKDATSYYWMPTYLSFYLGDVWKLPGCKTIRVYVEDETYPDVKYYDFSKEQIN